MLGGEKYLALRRTLDYIYRLGPLGILSLLLLTPQKTPPFITSKRGNMATVFKQLWAEEGQDIAEYAVMLAVVLAVVVGTIRLIGSSANNVFSDVASSIK